MSEAENIHNSEVFESNTHQESTPEVQTSTESGWVTVDFPHAISVENIPITLQTPDLQIQELERFNQTLVTRVAELEIALGQAKSVLRTETERMETLAGAQYAKQQQRSQHQEGIIKRQQQDLTFAATRIRDQEIQLAQQTEKLSAAQTQVERLTQELAWANQAAQKHQILVETLSAQLESSQEQVARFERECALVQQKYSEQVALVQQAENTCRDLRSRLQRQQRYTLQFKVALEKCLDVQGSSSGRDEMEDCASCAPSGDSLGANRSSTARFVKAQPVQPWSASLFPTFDPDELEPEEPVQPESTLEVEPSAASLLESLRAAQQSEWSELDEERTSDANPFAIDLEGNFIVEGVEEVIVPEVTIETTALAIRETHLLPGFLDEENEEVEEAPLAVDYTPSNSPFITLSSTPKRKSAAKAERTTSGSSGPSPVIYPERSTKKISSLAAVDLPTFPRNN
jgi:hypothetical protein